MKIKTLVAVVLLSSGVTSAFAQTEDCNSNSSISHEAVNAKNYKDAYEPCMAVLRDCPTLRYYTFLDAIEIHQNLLKGIKDRNSAEYQKLFDGLMEVHDLRMKYIPEFIAKGTKLSLTVDGALGAKAIDYMVYAPKMDVKQAYAWFKQSVDADKANAQGAILHYFLNTSMEIVKADKSHVDQFFQDYIDASNYIDQAIAAQTNERRKKNLESIKENLVAMFVSSGVADCESLQAIYGPQVEEHKTDSTFLKKAVNIFSMMKCTDSDAYFKASEYMYTIDPTAEAAMGVGGMYFKKGDYETAVKLFNEGLDKEVDNNRKCEMATAIASAFLHEKRYSQCKTYCQKAISYNSNNGNPYLLLATAYASSPNWTDEAALNKCTYFLVLDKLRRAKAVDSSVAEQADELIATYSRHTPSAEDLFMLGYQAGDRIDIGGWIGESTTIR